ncbi:MAG: hypothetical protein WA615_27940 [Bradyrhizobium sp.]|uniref:hypothetical protein n=1 Tax=Bradyrhizobium sp. TaxID=376 RepID=UPI003C7DB56F
MLQWRIAKRQYLVPASLAAMDRLRDAAGKFNDDLPFHQVAVAWRDAIHWPLRRIDIEGEPSFTLCNLNAH